MSLLFSGTSTGRLYEVGQRYSNGNGTYVANADGSFTNEKTGRKTVGSSQSDVQWFSRGDNGTSGVGSGMVNSGQGGSGPASPHVTNGVAGGGGGGGAGPGSPGVATGGSGSGGSGAGSSLVVAAPGAGPTWPKSVPLERVGVGAPQESLGAISDIGWIRTNTGWVSAPSNDAKQRTEDDVFQQAQWVFRNKVLPDTMLAPQPFPEFVKNPDALFYHPLFSEWQVKAGHVAIGGGF